MAHQVNRHELWPVVAAKLGWAVNPAQSSEPPRSAPQVANHMRIVYEAYVVSFEQQVSSVNLREFLGQRDHPPADGGQSHPPPGPQGQPQPQPTPQQAQLLNLVRFANHSADFLRKNGVSEAIIHQVELHRPALQRQQQLQLQRNPAFLQGVPAPTNLQNGQQMPHHPTNQGAFIAGQNQNGNHNQPFGTLGPTAGPSGQNGLGSMQQLPNNQMGQQMMEKSNQQKWAEINIAISRIKDEYARDRNNQPPAPKNIPDNEKAQINTFFEAFVRLATEIEKMLPMYFYLSNDVTTVKNLVSIVSPTETFS